PRLPGCCSANSEWTLRRPQSESSPTFPPRYASRVTRDMWRTRVPGAFKPDRPIARHGLRPMSRLLHRQFEREHRAFGLVVTRLDLPFVIGNDAAHDGQAQPRPG